MTLSLLLPIGLAALAALLVPLLVHLARRSEEHVIVFAALRWLQARPQPRRKRRFEEHLLLLVRLLLLAALALLLAEPVLFGKPDLVPRVIVAPGVDLAAARRVVDGDGDGDAARWQWLAPGFPDLERTAAAPSTATSPSASPSPSFASLVRELDATLPVGTPLTVLVPPIIDDADAERPLLSRRVDWRIVGAVRAADRVRAAERPMPALAVRYSPDRAASLRYLRAAGIAWQTTKQASRAASNPVDPASTVNIAPAAQAVDTGTRHLVWLVPGPLPLAIRNWIAAGGAALLDTQAVMPELADAPVLWRNEDGVLARGMRLGRGRVMRLERTLLPGAMPALLEPDFPAQLQQLFAVQPDPPARVDATAYAPRVGAAAYPETPRPLAPWLAMLIAALFIVERWLANGPRRRSVS